MRNREAPLRVCLTPDASAVSNVEFKAIDNCANPYLALGALACAGMLGIDRGLRLPEPCDGDPAALSDQERAERGILPLKVQLDEVLQEWDQDTGARQTC